MKRLLPTITLLIFLYLMGCTAHPAYSIGQSWRDNQCDNIMDAEERNRCISGAKQSYDDYKRESDAAIGK
ncbi:MAG: hypothetical protein HOP36_00515 [Methyloglobulus sp.]|nr:hypothetical protein [Methyloglobulus sp.]